MRRTTADKIAIAQAKKQEHENELKRLLKQQRAEERKARTKRLIERGAIAESLIENPADLTNEEFISLVSAAFNLYKKHFPTKINLRETAPPDNAKSGVSAQQGEPTPEPTPAVAETVLE